MKIIINALILAFLSFLLIASFVDLIFAESAESLYQQALNLEKKGQRDFAIFKYNTIIRNYPSSELADDALFKIGEFYYLNKDYFNARANFNSLIIQYPKSQYADKAKVYLDSMADMFKKYDVEDEIKKMLSEIESLRMNKKWDNMVELCDKIVSLGPVYEDYKKEVLGYYKQCADAYVAKEDLGKAKITYEKVMKIAPDDTEVLNKLYEVNKLLPTEGHVTK